MWVNGEGAAELHKLNGLKIQPGERFVTKVNHREFEIQKIQMGYAVVRDVATGQDYTYGVEALKRLLIEEGYHETVEPGPYR